MAASILDRCIKRQVQQEQFKLLNIIFRFLGHFIYKCFSELSCQNFHILKISEVCFLNSTYPGLIINSREQFPFCKYCKLFFKILLPKTFISIQKLDHGIFPLRLETECIFKSFNILILFRLTGPIKKYRQLHFSCASSEFFLT